MHRSNEAAERPSPSRRLGRAVAAVLFSVVLGASGAALAHGGGGGGHGGGGFHGGGFHGGGFHGGGFHGGGLHAGRFHGGFHRGFYPGVGVGLGLGVGYGLGYPWGWDDYPSDYGYYGYGGSYAGAQNWYYCSNPAGYYPYVSQCYGAWQVVPAS
jgi:hypothetical protein